MTPPATSGRHLSKFEMTAFLSNFSGVPFCLTQQIGGFLVHLLLKWIFVLVTIFIVRSLCETPPSGVFAYSDRSVCLPRCVLWPNGARWTYSVYRRRIGIWGRDFGWYHFRPPVSMLTPRIGRGVITWHWNCDQTVTETKLRLCIKMGGLSVGESFSHHSQ